MEKSMRIGLFLFGGFALPDVARILEIYQSSGQLVPTMFKRRTEMQKDIDFLSLSGGRVGSASGVFIWTESIDTCSSSGAFHILFVVGGRRGGEPLGDKRLISWLQDKSFHSKFVVAIGNCRGLLDAAGIEHSAYNPALMRCESSEWGDFSQNDA
ncbi:type 1 glutamine amidotransferase family protein [Paraburkholderia tropica]|uniref:hypothetical protein n=1 Tax=Paraburkholderia tropica TaxID=92647 RepID=UPI002AB6A222|nr:hypothetical protein [Paraburkholderia tropica]